MPQPRKPVALARITGADIKHKSRFAGRNEPVVTDGLGDPPDWLKDTDKSKAREAWLELNAEIPWLNSSHRTLVEIDATVRGRLMAGGEVGSNALNLLRQCLGSMGASPVDASKVNRPDRGFEDPAESHFL